MWVQQLNKLGLIGRHDDKTCATRSSGQFGRNDWVTHSPVKKLQSVRSARALSRVLGKQKLTTLEKLPIFDDGDNEELEHDVRSFVDKNDSSHDSRFEAGC